MTVALDSSGKELAKDSWKNAEYYSLSCQSRRSQICFDSGWARVRDMVTANVELSRGEHLGRDFSLLAQS